MQAFLFFQGDILIRILSFLLCLLFIFPDTAFADEIEISAQSAVVMDAYTKTVLYEKNADISGAAFLMANGHKIDKNDYTVTVSKTRDGKIGTITYKASKNSKSFSGSRKIKFQYIATAK